MDFHDAVTFYGYDPYPAPEPYCIECLRDDALEYRQCPGEGSEQCHHGEAAEGVECARCEGTGELPWCTKCKRWVDISDWWRSGKDEE